MRLSAPVPEAWLDSFHRRGEMLDAIYTLLHADEPLLVLRAAATLREIGADIRRLATAAAREQGATWAQIGEASKTSRQQEHRRYGQLDSSSPDD